MKKKEKVRKLRAVELHQTSRSAKPKFFKIPGVQNHYISHCRYFTKTSLFLHNYAC